MGRSDGFLMRGCHCLAGYIRDDARSLLVDSGCCCMLQAGQGVGALDLPFASEKAVDERNVGKLVNGELDVKVGMFLTKTKRAEQ